MCRGERFVLRADGGRLRDVSGIERFGVWTDRVLAIDGATILSMRREPSRRRHRIEGALRGLCGAAEPTRTRFAGPDGALLFHREAEGLWSPERRQLVSCGPELPDALAGLLALGVLDGDPLRSAWSYERPSS